MTSHKMVTYMTFTKTVLGLLLGVLIVTVLARVGPAQEQASLVITSPINGFVVAPGQTIVATVQAKGTFQQVTIFAQNPLYSDQVLMSPPYQFSILIPNTVSPGTYNITAFGAVTAGNGMKSSPVTLRVENPNPVVSLKTDLTELNFRFVGEQMPILVKGSFSDGTSVDLSNSQGITYASNNAGVVAVNSVGLVTATGAGNADIIIRYGGQSVDVAISVPRAARGDLDGDGDVDQDDLNILLEGLNGPATKPVDARDLNKDGKIDALDSRLLVNACSRSRCATK
jgi:hypothetical protein